MSKIIVRVPTVPAQESEHEEGTWYDGETIKYFSMAEADLLISSVSGWYQMVYLFLFETACRIQEAREVRIKDVDFNTNKIRVTTLKQRRSAFRVLVISDKLKSMILLHQVKDKLSPSDFVLAHGPDKKPITKQVVWSSMLRHCKELGIDTDKAHAHTWRHTRAIQLLESGEVDVVRLKDFLGHRSLISTLVYSKFSNKHITEAVQRANLKLGLN
ncbi:MAG: site-specific integrase [Brevinematales bacterium]|jgi:integrase/recombinase XerD